MSLGFRPFPSATLFMERFRDDKCAKFIFIVLKENKNSENTTRTNKRG